MTRYPYTIDNGHGERLTFLGVTPGPDGDRAEAERIAQPGAGPPMHVRDAGSFLVGWVLGKHE